ncbi:MAG: molybdopterin-binding/glycosyltransferase family 2 protein [Deltaproteobacteria bacterium]
MKFGPIAVEDAEGTYLGHTHRLPDGALKKGRRLTADDVQRLVRAGITTVVVARLDKDDVHEDDAAASVAARVCGGHVRIAEATTGRANLFAERRGVFVVDRAGVDALNTIDPAITFATIEPDRIVEAGDLVATVKIIPLGVPRSSIAEAERTAALISIAPLETRRAGLVLTTLPGVKDQQLTRAEQSQRQRLAALGSALTHVERVPHDEGAVAAAIQRLDAAGCDPILLLGASAITDPQDVLPSAIRSAGGEVRHVGMPVDPGNLLVLGTFETRTVIGVPGCARSLARSGFDRVLERTVAGITIAPRDIMGMGVGGLMKDIDARPHPRQTDSTKPSYQIGAVVLAAGQSRRMGAQNKLLAEVGGQPMVRRAVTTLVAANVAPIVVVVGHEADRVRAALSELDVDFADNPSFADGLSTSIRTGAAALEGRVDGALFMLSDMPWVTDAHLRSLIEAFDPEAGHTICVPTHAGRRGNPILWAARHFHDMQRLTGDVGARPLLAEHAAQIAEVEVDDRGVHFDVDTPQALAELDDPTA